MNELADGIVAVDVALAGWLAARGGARGVLAGALLLWSGAWLALPAQAGRGIFESASGRAGLWLLLGLPACMAWCSLIRQTAVAGAELRRRLRMRGRWPGGR